MTINSGPCAYCSHADAHHRDPGHCTECVKDRHGDECHKWLWSMADRAPTRKEMTDSQERSK